MAEKQGIILYSEATLNELEQVLNRKKFNKYFSLEDRQVFLLKFISASELVSILVDVSFGELGRCYGMIKSRSVP